MSLPEFHEIGKALPRKEDYRLLTGHGCYVDDLEVPGALHACFVRSPHAHARILAIDVEPALAIVEAVQRTHARPRQPLNP